MDTGFLKFPDGFRWGAAMCAFSIEGAWNEDGKGESIWDRFSHQKRGLNPEENGDIACDHYHRYEEDIDIMARMGLHYYRMSLSWPRIMPQGTGPVNRRGLDFYDRLIDRLLEKHIEPMISLYVWDMPQALVDARKDWRTREGIAIFADYARLIVERYSDRVTNWETICEPTIIAVYGYKLGQHAPGLKLGPEEFYQVAHNLLLAHGTGVQILRTCAKKRADIGLACNFAVKVPRTASPEDLAAAKRAWYDGEDTLGGNGWWYDPIFKGHYPEELFAQRERYLRDVRPEDFTLISSPIDYCGVNIYSGELVEHDPTPGSRGFRYVPYPPDWPRNNHSEGWPINPDAMYYGIRIPHELYGIQRFIVTENGVCLDDMVSADGKVHDPGRIDYYKRYLAAVHRLIGEGITVDAFTAWTLIDNFECNQGYQTRFGLVYLDLRTKNRIWKDSAFWYRDVIRNNGFFL